MRTGLLTAAMAATIIVSVSIPADAHRPHRYGGFGMHHRCCTTSALPALRTLTVERTTTVYRTSRPERKLMAVAYIQKNDYLTISKYCGFTGLDSKFAEAELDSFTLDTKDPFVRTTMGKKVVYKLADE